MLSGGLPVIYFQLAFLATNLSSVFIFCLIWLYFDYCFGEVCSGDLIDTQSVLVVTACSSVPSRCQAINSSPHGQNGCHFANDIFRCIFVNGKFCILIKISQKFIPKCQIDNPALVQIMAWRQIGNKPLSEPMLTHLHEPWIFYPSGHWPETVTNVHVSAHFR